MLHTLNMDMDTNTPINMQPSPVCLLMNIDQQLLCAYLSKIIIRQKITYISFWEKHNFGLILLNKER